MTAAARTALVMDRKLATILAADVVDYARLMERDEKGIYERLRAGTRNCSSRRSPAIMGESSN